tara:strand:+ start:3192 stop:4022 length:831 start_codon:yes stop_codon:yes gene_type:complete
MPKYTKIKETINLLKIIQESIIPNKNSWRIQFKEELVLNHINSLSTRQLGKLFSDPYWIRYPTWRYSGSSGVTGKTDAYGKWYGTVISQLVRKMSIRQDVPFEVMQKKSVGLWALYCIDWTSGKQRVSLMKRVYKNKDSRVRLRAARWLPVSYLPKMAKDPSSAVRNMVIRRLGMDNCSEMFLNDKDRWIHRSAIEAAPLESIDYMSIIEKFRESAEEVKKGGSKYAYAEFESSVSVILKKVPKEQLPYFLDLVDLANSSWHRTTMRDVIKARMTS